MQTQRLQIWWREKERKTHRLPSGEAEDFCPSLISTEIRQEGILYPVHQTSQC